MAASAPRSRGTPSGSEPSTAIFPWRDTSVADGLRPTNDQRPQRSCSTDSKRKPGWSPTRRAKAATGVVRSATSSRQTGTTVAPAARAWKSSLLGFDTSEEAGEAARVARALPLLLDLE